MKTSGLVQYDTDEDVETQNYEGIAEAFISNDESAGSLSYDISTNAASEGDLTEGEEIQVTVTRKGADLDLISTIYLNTMAGNTDAIDAETMELTKVVFNPNEETKTFTLKTFVDFENEGNEYFYIGRYDTYAQGEEQNAVDAAKVFVSDIDPDSQHYSYAIDLPMRTVEDGESYAIFNEGYAVPVTIRRTRDTENLDTDVESTIYFSTFEGIADDTEVEMVDRMPVTFAADEMEKTIYVNTYNNGVRDLLPKNFSMGVFKTYEDAVWTTDGVWAQAFLQDDDTDHNFTISKFEYSNSATDEGERIWTDGTISDITDKATNTVSAQEGNKVRFTITRDIGEQDIGANVYINTSGGYSTAADYQAMNAEAFSFAQGEREITVEMDIYRDSDSTESDEFFYFQAFNNHYDAYWDLMPQIMPGWI